MGATQKRVGAETALIHLGGRKRNGTQSNKRRASRLCGRYQPSRRKTKIGSLLRRAKKNQKTEIQIWTGNSPKHGAHNPDHYAKRSNLDHDLSNALLKEVVSFASRKPSSLQIRDDGKRIHEQIRAIKVSRLRKEKGTQDLPEDHGRHKKRGPRKYRQQHYSNQACCSVSRPHTKEHRRILRAFYKKRLEDLVRKRIRL